MKELNKLRSIQTKPELAKYLGITSVFLTNVLYIQRPENLYTEFKIPKKTGGTRTILAPKKNLKFIQRMLSYKLMLCLAEIRSSKYQDKNNESKLKIISSHGFEQHRSIITNAERHRNKKNVLNVDLEGFFDSFNFGRVRGFFIKNEFFSLNPEIATVIAQIACVNNILPQGSPCSPVITNLICMILDVRLNALASKYKSTYTRYADDLTFSTNQKDFNMHLVKKNNDQVIVSKKLELEIIRAGFKINPKKTSLRNNNVSQQVTGLVVNEKINTNNHYHKTVRAMCYSLFKTGQYTLIDKKTFDKREGTLNELEGMLGFIDQIDKYNNIQDKKMYREITKNKREKNYANFILFKYFCINTLPTIITEGKTDHIHIKTALRALKDYYPSLIEVDKEKNSFNYKFNFLKFTEKNKFLINFDGGTSEIETMMKLIPSLYDEKFIFNNNVPVIFILDNDKAGIKTLNALYKCYFKTKDSCKEQFFKYKNIYVTLLPTPIDKKDFFIEKYYDDSVLKIKHENKVLNETNNNCKADQYSKTIFATKVIQENFHNISFENFRLLLDKLDEFIKK